jgi:prevent-host-death family protein
LKCTKYIFNPLIAKVPCDYFGERYCGISRARTNLSELVQEVENGAEKIITKNGEPVVAMQNLGHTQEFLRLD